jgi:hypothetical protein
MCLIRSTGNIGSVFRDVETHSNMTLGAQIIDFVRLQFVEEFDEVHGIRQVAEVQEEAYPMHMRVLVQMIDARCVKGGGTSDNAVNLVALG